MGSSRQKIIKARAPRDVHIAWERDFSFLGTYLMACQHMKNLKKDLNVSYSMCAFFHQKNQIKFYRSEKDEKQEGKMLALKYLRSKIFRENIFNGIINYSDLIAEFIKTEKKLTKDNIYDFFSLLNKHFSFHHAVFWTADHLGKNNLQNKYSEHLKNLYKVRKYNEEIIPKVETWFLKNNSDCLLLTPEECINYKTKNKRVSSKIQKNRNSASFSYFNCSGSVVFIGEKALFYDKKFNQTILNRFKQRNIIKGKTAYIGKYQGIVRVVINFSYFKKLKKGEVLVTPMTLPKYNHFIYKAGAIITDEGAVLSHAAIISRELKKPCVIGTKIATQVLKDGDLVEVDADKGVVKIIS